MPTVKIEPTHMVVDRRDCSEIKDATAADEEDGWVWVRRPTYNGDVEDRIYMPQGVKIVRRR